MNDAQRHAIFAHIAEQQGQQPFSHAPSIHPGTVAEPQKAPSLSQSHPATVAGQQASTPSNDAGNNLIGAKTNALSHVNVYSAAQLKHDENAEANKMVERIQHERKGSFEREKEVQDTRHSSNRGEETEHNHVPTFEGDTIKLSSNQAKAHEKIRNLLGHEGTFHASGTNLDTHIAYGISPSNYEKHKEHISNIADQHCGNIIKRPGMVVIRLPKNKNKKYTKQEASE